MKSLLICLLVHYYSDIKRQIPAKLSRKIDDDIRDLCHDKPELAKIRSNCKNIAEAEKARIRRAETKRMKNYKHAGNPHVKHVPCRDRKLHSAPISTSISDLHVDSNPKRKGK